MLHQARFRFLPAPLGPAALSFALAVAAGLAPLCAQASSTARAGAPHHGLSNPRAAGQTESEPVPDLANYTMYIYADREPDPRDAVARTLSAWASYAAKNDVADETSFYAPKLDRYFLRRNVSREYVERDKQSLRNRGSEIHDFRLSNLRFVALSGDAATVSVSKSWVLFDARTTVARAGSTRSLLWLRRTPDGWKITGEQDLKG